MPEKGWYSLTVRTSTAKAVKELAKANGVTIDDLLKELIANQSNARENAIPPKLIIPICHTTYL